jgi:hypothetical protein
MPEGGGLQCTYCWLTFVALNLCFCGPGGKLAWAEPTSKNLALICDGPDRFESTRRANIRHAVLVICPSGLVLMALTRNEHFSNAGGGEESWVPPDRPRPKGEP